MSNIDKYTNFISEQVRTEGNVGLRTGPVNEWKSLFGQKKEAPQSADFHKDQFEKHAKLTAGHKERAGFSWALGQEHDTKIHDAKANEHFKEASKHAAAYHKMTGKKVTMVPRVNFHKDGDGSHYKLGYNPKHVHDAGIKATHDFDQRYLPKHEQMDKHWLQSFKQ